MKSIDFDHVLTMCWPCVDHEKSHWNHQMSTCFVHVKTTVFHVVFVGLSPAVHRSRPARSRPRRASRCVASSAWAAWRTRLLRRRVSALGRRLWWWWVNYDIYQNARAPPGASHGLCFPRLTERSLRIHALVKGPGVMAAGIHIYMGLYGMFPLNIP